MASDSGLEREGRSAAFERLLAAAVPLEMADIQGFRDRLGETTSCGPRASPFRGARAATLLIASGWAGSVCRFPDGRRQIVALLLPGDFIRPGIDAGGALDVEAFTSLKAVEAQDAVGYLDSLASSGQPLADAWTKLRQASERRMLRHGVRLGRMTALERTADFFLELLERLKAVGLASATSMSMPLTQDVLADHLGLSTVHMNRTLQQLRREGLIADRSGRFTIPDASRLRQVVPGAGRF